MASPQIIDSSSIRSLSNFGAATVGLASATTPSLLLNKNALVAQSTYYNDPYKLVAGDDDNGDKLVVLSVPKGSIYCFLTLAYVVGSGTHPTSGATVRAYGRTSKYSKDFADFMVGVLGNGFDSSEVAWDQLGNDITGVYDIQVGAAGTAPMRHNGNHYTSAPVPIHVSGCDAIVIPVRNPAAGPQFAAILGSFRR